MDICSRKSNRMFLLLIVIFLWIPIASAESIKLNGTAYYQKLDGSMTDTPSIITETSLGYRIDWLGMYYFIVWDGNYSYDTLNYPNGTFVSPWIMPRIEYWRTTGQPQWREVIPINNTFEQRGNQIIRRMVMSDNSKFEITYTITDKIKYTWNFTAGANQNYSIVFRMDSAASQVINSTNKRYTPGFFNNLTIYDWTDIPTPYAQNVSSSYSTSNRQFLQRIILGNLNASDPKNNRVIIDPQQQFNGSTTPAWQNTSLSNFYINLENNLELNFSGSNRDQYNYNTNDYNFVLNGQWIGQSFIAGTTGRLQAINATLFQVGTSPADLIIDVYNAGADDKPTGAILATQTFINTSVPTSSPNYYNFSKPAQVTSGNKYAVIAHTTATSGSNAYRWDAANNNPYGSGMLVYSTNQGGSWLTLSGYDDGFETRIGIQYLSGYVKAWYNAGSGQETANAIANGTWGSNTNSSFQYAQNGSNPSGFWTPANFSTNTTSDTFNPRYQNTDVFIWIFGNGSSSGNISQIILNTQASGGGDTTPPTYSGAGHNQTVAGQPTLFSALYNDNNALHPNGQYIFSTNNTGVWVNDSNVNWTTTPQWANITKTLNSTVGAVIGYRWYANDSAGNINNTPIYTLTTTSAPLTEFMPPAPVSLSCTNGNFYRNCTWQAGTGNVTTKYNTTVNGTAINGTQPPQNMTTVPHGNINRTIRAVNASGNGTENLTSLSDNFQIPNNAPVLTPIGDKTVNEGQPLNFSLIATDADGDPLTYASNSSLFKVNSTTGNVNVSLLYNQSGIYYVSFNATDNNSGVSFSNITITVNNTTPIPVSDCGILNIDGETYNLTQNISGNGGGAFAGYCISVQADNITLKGNYHWINLTNNGNNINFNQLGRVVNNITIQDVNLSGDKTQNAAIENDFGYNKSKFYNISIMNVNNAFDVDGIIRDSTLNNIIANDNGNGIYIASSTNITISNSSAKNSTYDGFNILSSTNITISNSSANNNGRSGFYISGGKDINFSNLEVCCNSGQVTYGDLFFGDLALNVTFQDMNLSNIYRRIYFNVGTEAQIFDANKNNIDLKTNISIAGKSIDRQVFSWTKDNLTWNDNNATGGVVAYYNLSGLYSNRAYDISLNGTLKQTLTTYSNGSLPIFNISLINGANQISVIAGAVTINGTPNITKYCNDINGCNQTAMSINAGNTANFNVTVNQTVTSVSWKKDGVEQQNTSSTTWSYNFGTIGTFNITAQGFNANGSSNVVYTVVSVVESGGGGTDYDYAYGWVKYPNGTGVNGATVYTSVGNQNTGSNGYYSYGYVFIHGNSYNFNITKSGFNWSNQTVSFAAGDYQVVNATIISNPLPNITSWSNSNTSNGTLSLTLPRNTNVTFNITSDQPLTSCTWAGATQINCSGTTSFAFKNFTNAGSGQTVSVYVTNSNGSSLPITWTINVQALGGYVLSGNVKNSLGLNLQNARIDFNSEYKFTDANGNYSFTNVNEGTQTALARAITYENSSASISISKDTNADFVLSEKVWATEEQTNNAGSLGFIGGIVGGVLAVGMYLKRRRQ